MEVDLCLKNYLNGYKTAVYKKNTIKHYLDDSLLIFQKKHYLDEGGGKYSIYGDESIFKKQEHCVEKVTDRTWRFQTKNI